MEYEDSVEFGNNGVIRSSETYSKLGNGPDISPFSARDVQSAVSSDDTEIYEVGEIWACRLVITQRSGSGHPLLLTLSRTWRGRFGGVITYRLKPQIDIE